MSIEGTANTEYASLSGKIRTFVVDKTLTVSGACADAKATGEAIEKNAGAAAEEYLGKELTPAVEAAVSNAIAEVIPLIEERALVVNDTYTGTGESTKTLTFPFAPKLVIVSHLDTPDVISICVAGTSKASINLDYNGSAQEMSLTWEGNSLTMIKTGASGGCQNTSGEVYAYTAIG